ncbi:MAG: hypothetical protein H7343_07875, partial [Undibacterium sp.]|nr:hypothetical protein [Opitutaceae bacterium]
LVGVSREGFPLLVLTQASGGIMTVGATVGLARQSGLGRSASILAGALLLGMGNVVAQFTAAQTDLFTAGVFAVSFYLWLAALRRREALGRRAPRAGLALGAKGTLFYLAPGAVLWVAWLAWQHPLPWPQWRRTLLAAALGLGLFAAPAFVRNWRAYGDALGPAVWVKKHHKGFDSVSGQTHKIYWNLTSALAQNLEPQSQPPGLRALSQTAGLALVASLPASAQDPYTLNHIDRRLELEKILRRSEPDADATSFGLITLLLFSAGTLIALARWRRPPARLILVWSAGVIIFLVFFLTMQQWHPFSFRYFVLVAPWIALVAAWGIEQLAPRPRTVVWTLALAGVLAVSWHVTLRTHQAGWRAVTQPTRSLGFFVSHGWREWSRQLDQPETPFTLDLPEERPLSAFYRQWPRRDVAYLPESAPAAATAEAAVRGLDGWLIVPASHFLGREGRVAASVWLLGGDETSPFSLAAYRSLGPDEKPNPVIYRQRRTLVGPTVTFDLLIKSAGAPTVRVAFANPAPQARDFRWATPLTHQQATLAPGERRVIELPLPADAVSEVKIIFTRVSGDSDDALTVELVR